MPVDTSPYLQQLEIDELASIGKTIGARITKDMNTKTKLIVALKANSVTKQDVISFFKKDKEGRTGIYAKYDGESYEKKVANYFLTKEGYKCELNKRDRGTEFDIIGYKGSKIDAFFTFSNRKCIVVECKNVPIVSNQDFQKFAGKFKGFKESNDKEVNADLTFHGEMPFKGYIVTSGIFEPLAWEESRKHKDIELKRLRF